MQSKLIRNILVLVAVLSIVGCKKEKRPDGKQQAKPATTPRKVSKGSLSSLNLPGSAIAALSLPSLKGSLDKLATFGAQVHPAAGTISTMAIPGMAKSLGLKDPTPIDPAKPLHVAIFDPKTYRGAVQIVGIKDRKSFTAALANAKPDVEGNALGNKGRFRSRYYNFLGDNTVVITPEAKLFGKHKDFFTKLAAVKAEHVVEATLSVKNTYALYQGVMRNQLAAIKKMGGPQAAQMGPMFDTMLKMFSELDQINSHLALGTRGASFVSDMVARAGTSTHKAIGSLKRSGDVNGLLAQLPAEAAILIAGAIDTKAAGDVMDKLTQWSMSMSVMGDAARKKVNEATKGFWKAMDGRFAFSVGLMPKIQALGLYGLADEKAAAKKMASFLSLYNDAAFTGALKAQGFDVKYEPEAAKVGDVAIGRTSMKVNSKSKMAMMGRFAEFFTSHFAVARKLGIYGLGASSLSAVQALVKGEAKSKLDKDPGVQAALRVGGANAIGWMYVSIGRALKQGLALAGKSNIKLPSVPPGGITFAMSTSGGIATFTVDLPNEQAKAIGTVVGSLGPRMR